MWACLMQQETCCGMAVWQHDDLAPIMVLHCGVLECEALSDLSQLPGIALAQHEGLHGVHAVQVEDILHARNPLSQ